MYDGIPDGAPRPPSSPRRILPFLAVVVSCLVVAVWIPAPRDGLLAFRHAASNSRRVATTSSAGFKSQVQGSPVRLARRSPVPPLSAAVPEMTSVVQLFSPDTLNIPPVVPTEWFAAAVAAVAASLAILATSRVSISAQSADEAVPLSVALPSPPPPPPAPCALVTGGGSKVGAVVSAALHAAGYRVVIHYASRAADAEAVCSRLNALRPDSAVAVAADFVTAPEAAAADLVRRTLATFGRIDAVVNCAALFEATDLPTLQAADWTRQLNVNLAAPLFVVQQALPQLQERRGSVVNICDIHGDRPLAGHVVYSVSKSGLIALTKALAKDLGSSGVRVNGVSPGAISWIPEKHDEATQREIIGRVPLGTVGPPECIAAAVLFLLRNEYVTGQILAVDGGRCLNQ